jgi:hypothetical protein
LPDTWETAHGLNNTDGTGTNGNTGNADGDRYDNLSEFIFGLSPAQSDDYQPSVLKATTGFDITFTTIPDRWYRVFASNDLTTWTPITPDQLGTGSPITVNDPTALPVRFYRVEARLVTP